MAIDKDEAPMRGLTGDPGKGTLKTPPNDGDLWSGQAIKRGYKAVSNGYDSGNGPAEMWEGEARGDKFPSGTDASNTGMNPGAPVWTDGRGIMANDENVVGSIVSDCKSDGMFDKFKHEETSWAIDANRTDGGRNTADSVASKSLPSDDSGTHSDPEFARLPVEQQSGSGQDYYGKV